MRLLAWILATLALLVVIADAGAEELGTAAQAKAMIQQAIEAIKANEADAIHAFNDKDNKQFHLLDLYVFCINTVTGKFTAQSAPVLLGTDAEGLSVGQDQVGSRLLSMLRGAPEGKIMSVAYKAMRPGTTSGAVPKVSFVARVGKQGCGIGYYR
jgi:long-subunit fatty acid transport protein